LAVHSDGYFERRRAVTNYNELPTVMEENITPMIWMFTWSTVVHTAWWWGLFSHPPSTAARFDFNDTRRKARRSMDYVI
jgi:hypothetical protein